MGGRGHRHLHSASKTNNRKLLKASERNTLPQTLFVGGKNPKSRKRTLKDQPCEMSTVLIIVCLLFRSVGSLINKVTAHSYCACAHSYCSHAALINKQLQYMVTEVLRQSLAVILSYYFKLTPSVEV